MWYPDEKRTEKLILKLKPSILAKAKEAWFATYPHSEDANFDDFFQQMIIEVASAKGLLKLEDLPEHLRNVAMAEQKARLEAQMESTESENSDTVEEATIDTIYGAEVLR